MGRIRNLLVFLFRLPFKFINMYVRHVWKRYNLTNLHISCTSFANWCKKKKRKKNRNERVLSTNTRNSVRRNSYRFNNCVSPALIFIIYAHPKIGIQKFRREMDLIASPSERFKLIFNSAFQRHPVFLSLKNFSISKQLKTWKNRY